MAKNKKKDYLDRAIARITEEEEWSYDQQQAENLAERKAKDKKCNKPSCEGCNGNCK